MVPQAYSGSALGLPPRDSRPENPANKRSLLVARELAYRDPPGFASDDRWRQVQNYTGAVYLCIEQIATGIAGATVRVTQKRPDRTVVPVNASVPVHKAMPTPHAESDDEEWVPAPEGHPLCELFEYVNRVDTLGDLLSQWVVHEELHGTAILWPVLGPRDEPVELWTIPPALTQQIQTGLSPEYPWGAIRVWNWHPNFVGYGHSGGQFILDNRDVLRPRKMHPLYRFSEYSPLTAGANELDQLQSISESRKKAMDHGFSPDVALSIPGATIDELNRVTALLENKYGGPRGRKILVTDGESVEATKLNTAPKDMDFPAGWEQMIKFVCAMFKTTSSIVGLTEADSYAAFYAKLKQHHTMCLGPKAKRMGDYLTKHLSQKWWHEDRLRITIDLPKIDDHDVQDRQLSQDGQSGAVTVNEIRAARNRKPVEGGDVPPAIYLAVKQQEVAPQPDTMAAAMGGGAGMGGDDAVAAGAMGDDDGSDPAEAVTQSVLQMLGVSGGDEPGMVQPQQPTQKSRDKTGHEHRGKGPGGGQFAPGGQGGRKKIKERAAAHLQQEREARAEARRGDGGPKDTAGQVQDAFAGLAGGIKEASDKKTAADVAAKGHTAFQRDASADLFAKDHPDWKRTKEGGEHRFYPPPGWKPGQQSTQKPQSQPTPAQQPQADKPWSPGDPPKMETASDGTQFRIRGEDDLREFLDYEANTFARRIPQVRQAVAGMDQAAIPVAQAVRGNRRAQVLLARPGEWADQAAAKHAPKLAKKLGISPEDAKGILSVLIQKMAGQVVEHLNAGGIGGRTSREVGGHALIVERNKKQGGFRTTMSQPKKRNPAGKGSLPKRAVAKSLRRILKSLPG